MQVDGELIERIELFGKLIERVEPIGEQSTRELLAKFQFGFPAVVRVFARVSGSTGPNSIELGHTIRAVAAE